MVIAFELYTRSKVGEADGGWGRPGTKQPGDLGAT